MLVLSFAISFSFVDVLNGVYYSNMTWQTSVIMYLLLAFGVGCIFKPGVNGLTWKQLVFSIAVLANAVYSLIYFFYAVGMKTLFIWVIIWCSIWKAESKGSEILIYFLLFRWKNCSLTMSTLHINFLWLVITLLLSGALFLRESTCSCLKDLVYNIDWPSLYFIKNSPDILSQYSKHNHNKSTYYK